MYTMLKIYAKIKPKIRAKDEVDDTNFKTKNFVVV